MKRHGIRLGVRAECLAEYTRYHVRIWPEIEAAISEEFARQATDDGVWGEASTWLVSARVPSD